MAGTNKTTKVRSTEPQPKPSAAQALIDIAQHLDAARAHLANVRALTAARGTEVRS